MNHAFLARCKLKECAKFFNADNFADIDLAFFKLRSDHLNHFDSLVNAFFFNATDCHSTIIGNINLNTRLINNLVDDLTLGADNITNLLRINHNLLNLRCIFTNFLTWFSNGWSQHFIDNIFSRLFCPANSFFNNRTSQTVNLDIHLNGSDTVMGTGYFKVHIAKEVFKALNICQYNIVVICISGNKSGRNTSHLFFNRNTSRHQGHGRCTDTCLGCGTIRFKGFGNRTNRIWELFHARKYRDQSFFSQGTMTDFTTSRSSGRFCFTNRIGREIIMVHITFGCHIYINAVNTLCLRHWSQCGYCTNLSLSTGEHSRAMNSRKQIDFCSQWTNLIQRTAIRTFMVFQNHLTNRLFLILINSFVNQFQPLFIFGESFSQFFFNLTDIFLTYLFFIGKYCFFHRILRNDFFNCCE